MTEEEQAGGRAGEPSSAAYARARGRGPGEPEKLPLVAPNETHRGGLKDLHRELFPIDYDEHFYDKVVRQTHFTRVVVDEDRVVAVCTLDLKPAREVQDEFCTTSDNTTQFAYVLTLGVASTHRRRGIASRLLAWAVETAQAIETCRALYLHVALYNRVAIDFYMHHGFERCFVLGDYYVINHRLYDALLVALFFNGGRRKRWRGIVPLLQHVADSIVRAIFDALAGATPTPSRTAPMDSDTSTSSAFPPYMPSRA